MNKILNKINKNYLQVLILYSSTILSIPISIAVSILNTNYLTTLQYGDVKYVTNIMMFVSGLLMFGFFVSGCRLIAICKNQENIRKYKGTMVLILFFSILIMSVIFLILSFVYYKWINPSLYKLFLIAIPICSAPLLLNYINTTAQGDNKILSISLSRLLPSLIYLLVGYFVFKHLKANSSLVLFLQNGIAVIVLAVIIYYSNPSFKNLSISKKKILIENKKYGFQVYIGSVVGVSLSYLAGITLGWFNSDNTLVGFYTLALTISSPLSMLPSIVGTTYYRQFASENFINKKVYSVTILISIVSLIAFILLINPIVRLIYPADYSQVGNYSALLAIGMTFHGIGDMYNRFLAAHGQGKSLRNGAFITGGILIIGNIVLVYFFGIYGAIVTKILSSFGYFVAMHYFYGKFTRFNIQYI